jgi:UrcA family protein
MNIPFNRSLFAALGAAGLAFAAAPSLAQVITNSVGEVTVMGKWGPNGPQSLSRIVSVADLDLTTNVGVTEMKARVRSTARDICNELEGKGGGGPSGLVRSCEADAIASAQGQMRTAIAMAHGPRPLAEAPAYVAPAGDTAVAAEGTAADASAVAVEPTVTTTLVTNGSVPDTPENRARYGGPMSNAGKRTAPAGN